MAHCFHFFSKVLYVSTPFPTHSEQGWPNAFGRGRGCGEMDGCQPHNILAERTPLGRWPFVVVEEVPVTLVTGINGPLFLVSILGALPC